MSRRGPGWVIIGWLCALFVIERFLAVYLPTTWEWDALTRAQIAVEISRDGLAHYFLVRRETIWLPGYMLLHAALFRLFGGNPVVLAEYTSAVSAGLIAGYVYLLARLAGLSEPAARCAPALLLVSGYALASFSQSMTEAPSILCLIAGCYHLLRALDTRGGLHALIAAFAFAVHASMRWEGLLYLGLVPASLVVVYWRAGRRDIVPMMGRCAVILMPAALLGVIWLLYTRWAAGAAMHGVVAVRDSVHGLQRDYIGNPFGSAFVVLAGLVGTSGSLWMVTVPEWMALARRRISNHAPETSELVRGFLAVLTLMHLAWLFSFSLLGFLAGWPRHLLYVLPSTVVLFSAAAWSARAKRFHLTLSVVCGLVMFAVNRTQHRALLIGNPEYVGVPPIEVPR